MKKVLFILILIATISTLSSHAQRVRVQLDFPTGIAGAVWIGPEWAWRGGRYVCAPGHWQYSRHGYSWRRGHWR